MTRDLLIENKIVLKINVRDDGGLDADGENNRKGGVGGNENTSSSKKLKKKQVIVVQVRIKIESLHT